MLELGSEPRPDWFKNPDFSPKAGIEASLLEHGCGVLGPCSCVKHRLGGHGLRGHPLWHPLCKGSVVDTGLCQDVELPHSTTRLRCWGPCCAQSCWGTYTRRLLASTEPLTLSTARLWCQDLPGGLSIFFLRKKKSFLLTLRRETSHFYS